MGRTSEHSNQNRSSGCIVLTPSSSINVQEWSIQKHSLHPLYFLLFCSVAQHNHLFWKSLNTLHSYRNCMFLHCFTTVIVRENCCFADCTLCSSHCKNTPIQILHLKTFNSLLSECCNNSGKILQLIQNAAAHGADCGSNWGIICPSSYISYIKYLKKSILLCQEN